MQGNVGFIREDHVSWVVGPNSRSASHLGDSRWIENVDFGENLEIGLEKNTTTSAFGSFTAFRPTGWSTDFLCPDATLARTVSAGGGIDHISLTYSMNVETVAYGQGVQFAGHAGNTNLTRSGAGHRGALVKTPSDKFFFMDGINFDANMRFDWANPASTDGWRDNGETVRPASGIRYVAYRHPNEVTNILHFDGHVASFRPEEIWEAGAADQSEIARRHWDVAGIY